MRALVLVVSFLFGAPSAALAHGGGLDACGCHMNHKTGEYHCHRDTGKKDCTPKKPKSKKRR